MKLLFSSKTSAVVAAAAIFFSLSSRCFADPITLTSSAVSSTVLGASSDSLSLNAGSLTSDDSDGGLATFQTGDFLLGDSEIPNQIIPFTFQDTLTLNGITEVLNILGQDNVTTTADTLTLLAGGPVVFGNDFFALQPYTATGTAIGEDMPIELQASITPTPEPSTLLLFGTGVIVAIGLAAFSRRSLVQSVSDVEAPIPFAARPMLSRSWVQRGAALQPSASNAGRSPLQATSEAAPAGRRQSDAPNAD